MKKDIILAGVGGQGVLSIAAIIARAAVSEGLRVRQSEVHGMAQRGGAVLSHLRLADAPIASDLVPQGAASLIISMEPLESLRYAAWLAPDGALVTAAKPIVNIGDYPDMAQITQAIGLFPQHRLVDTAQMPPELSRSVNVCMVGAASWFLPIARERLEQTIAALFAAKGPAVVEANRRAFNAGVELGAA
jgi:indolepyruvate ferredoxin oxidoreductase beta subunit